MIPKIGRLEVRDIGIAQVLSVLEPIWQTTTETASRVRGRIELILAWADKRAERERLNPARWRDHLDTQLPRPSKVARPKRPLSDGANLTCLLSPCPRSCVRDPRREFGP